MSHLPLKLCHSAMQRCKKRKNQQQCPFSPKNQYSIFYHILSYFSIFQHILAYFLSRQPKKQHSWWKNRRRALLMLLAFCISGCNDQSQSPQSGILIACLKDWRRLLIRSGGGRIAVTRQVLDIHRPYPQPQKTFHMTKIDPLLNIARGTRGPMYLCIESIT